MASYPVRKGGKPRIALDVCAMYSDTVWYECMLQDRRESCRVANIVAQDCGFAVLHALPVVQGVEWILDTGAGRHLVSKKNVVGKVFTTEQPVMLLTANGEDIVNTATSFNLPALGTATREALVLNDSPHALSLGMLVERDGFYQTWSRPKGFKLYDSKGRLIDTVVKDFVPRLLNPDVYTSGAFILPRPAHSTLVVAPAVDAEFEDELFGAELLPELPVPLEFLPELLVPLEPVLPEPPAPVEPEVDANTEARLRSEATSLKHLCTHKPANRYCPVCQEAKCKRQSAFRKLPEDKHVESLFGDLLHFDHGTMRQSKDAGFEGELKALHVLDHATKLKGCFPSVSKSTKSVVQSLR